jgi:hypothetical protein
MKYFFTQKLSWNNINSFPNTVLAAGNIIDSRRSIGSH